MNQIDIWSPVKNPLTSRAIIGSLVKNSLTSRVIILLLVKNLIRYRFADLDIRRGNFLDDPLTKHETTRSINE